MLSRYIFFAPALAMALMVPAHAAQSILDGDPLLHAFPAPDARDPIAENDKTFAGLISALRNAPTSENWAAAARYLQEYSMHYVDPVDHRRYLDGTTGNPALLNLLFRAGALTQSERACSDLLYWSANQYPGEYPNLLALCQRDGGMKPQTYHYSDFADLLRERAKAAEAIDRNSLAQQQNDAKSAGTAFALSITAHVLVSYGEKAKAIEFADLAGAKLAGETFKDDEARDGTVFNLVIANYDLGRFDAALSALDHVSKQRRPIARLWTVFINAKKS